MQETSIVEMINSFRTRMHLFSFETTYLHYQFIIIFCIIQIYIIQNEPLLNSNLTHSWLS